MKKAFILAVLFLAGCKQTIVRYGTLDLPNLPSNHTYIETCKKVESYRSKASVSIDLMKQLLAKSRSAFAKAQISGDYTAVDSLILDIQKEREKIQSYFPEEFTIPTMPVVYQWTLMKSEIEEGLQNSSLPTRSAVAINLRGTLGKNSLDIAPGPSVIVGKEYLEFALVREASWTDICVIKYDINVRGDLLVLDKQSKRHLIPFDLRYRAVQL